MSNDSQYSQCHNNFTNPGNRPNLVWPSIIIAVIFAIAFVGNLAILLFIIKIKKLHTSTNLLMANVAFNDLLITVIVMPVCFLVSSFGQWPFSCTTCTILGCLEMTLYINALCSLAALSINRYYAIVCCFDKNFRKKMSINRAVFMIAFIWIYSIAWAIPPVFGWNRYIFYFSKLMCNMYQRDDSQYQMFVTIFCTALPTFVILYCSIRIIIRLWINAYRTRTTITRSSGLKIERRVTGMIGLIVLTYFICVAPNFLVGTLFAFETSNAEDARRYDVIQTVVTLIYLSNSAWNPVINGAMNPYLRKAVREKYDFQITFIRRRSEVSTRAVRSRLSLFPYLMDRDRCSTFDQNRRQTFSLAYKSANQRDAARNLRNIRRYSQVIVNTVCEIPNLLSRSN